MACTLGNKRAKNCCKRTILVQLIIEDVFLNTVYCDKQFWKLFIFFLSVLIKLLCCRLQRILFLFTYAKIDTLAIPEP